MTRFAGRNGNECLWAALALCLCACAHAPAPAPAAPPVSRTPAPPSGLNKEAIRQVIHQNRDQIQFCYESNLQEAPWLSGKIRVRFVISLTGSVRSATIIEATTQHPALERCVAARVRTWFFPKPLGGQPVTVSYPFIFKTLPSHDGPPRPMIELQEI